MRINFCALSALVVGITLLSCGNGTATAETTQTDSIKTVDSVKIELPDTITIAMTGDVNFGTNYPVAKLPVNGGKNLYDHTGDLLRNADVAAGNMEGVLSDSKSGGGKAHGKHSYFFRSPTSDGKFLEEAGYDFMGMANNHAFDFAEEGVKSTKATLDKHGIGHAGTIGDEYSIKTINGVKYGFAAFGHSRKTLHTFDHATVKRILNELRPQVDILIVTYHGGAEGVKHSHLPQGGETFLGGNRGNSRKFAHLCIDLGADIVFGHGPHVVRAMELYKGHLIAYSLGNFCTPGGMNVAGKTGYAPLLIANIDSKTGEFIDGKIHSFIQQRSRGPQPDTKNIVATEIRSLTKSDIKDQLLDIADDGTITRKK